MAATEIQDTTIRQKRGRLVLTNAFFKCTGPCGRTKPASEFGVRKMPNGETRNQSQCKKCRGEYK